MFLVKYVENSTSKGLSFERLKATLQFDIWVRIECDILGTFIYIKENNDKT